MPASDPKETAARYDGELICGVMPSKRVAPIQVDDNGALIISGTVAVTPSPVIVTGSVEVANDIGNPLPVFLAENTVTVDNFPAIQPVSGTVNVAQSGSWTVNLASEPTIDIGKVDQGTAGTDPWLVTGNLVTTPTGTQNVNVVSTIPVPVTDNGGSLTVDGTFFQATQPISGTVAVNNFPATQPVSGTVAVSSVGGSVAVTGPLTDSQLRATPVPVSGTVTTGGLTDAQLRSTPVPVSGTVATSVAPSLITTSLTPGWAVGTIGFFQTGLYGTPLGLLLSLTMTPLYLKRLMTDHGLKPFECC